MTSCRVSTETSSPASCSFCFQAFSSSSLSTCHAVWVASDTWSRAAAATASAHASGSSGPGSRRTRWCCRVRCRKEVQEIGMGRGAPAARRDDVHQRQSGCRGRSARSRAASRWGGRCGPRHAGAARGGRGGRDRFHGCRVTESAHAATPPVRVPPRSGQALALGQRAAVVVAANAQVGLVGGGNRVVDGAHVGRKAGLVARVFDDQRGLDDARAVRARLALDDRPDQVDNQLSGVQKRAKPTAP